MMFSGHAALLVVLCRLWWAAATRNPRSAFRWFGAGVSAAGSISGSFCLILGRQHYSVDVGVAIVLSHLLYSWIEKKN